MRKERAYSLIELLVVLSLISLITAIAMPNMLKLYRSFSNTLEFDEVARQINGIGYKANEQGREYWLFDVGLSATNADAKIKNGIVSADTLLNLPEGWSLDVDTPLKYLSNGSCKGGRVKILFEGVPRHSVELKPPYCRVIL